MLFYMSRCLYVCVYTLMDLLLWFCIRNWVLIMSSGMLMTSHIHSKQMAEQNTATMSV